MISRVLILGGGLAGLCTAYYLERLGFSCTIVESRERLGGRIFTRYSEASPPVELGATWLDNSQQNLLGLLAELNLATFPQELGKTAIYEQISSSPAQITQLPENSNPSYRIAGGSSSLVNALESSLQRTIISCSEKVLQIIDMEDRLDVITNKGTYHSIYIINTIPPYLFYKTITCNLPEGFKSLLASTHTWMGQSIKVSLTFPTKFWVERNLSGTIFSHVGPITEMYDQSDITNSLYALTGFVNGAYYSLTSIQRQKLVVQQLKKFYGPIVDSYSLYSECVWSLEKSTSIAYDQHVLPKQNNGDQAYAGSYLGGKLYFAGAETGSVVPGHMEAAVSSANRVVNSLISSISANG